MYFKRWNVFSNEDILLNLRTFGNKFRTNKLRICFETERTRLCRANKFVVEKTKFESLRTSIARLLWRVFDPLRDRLIKLRRKVNVLKYSKYEKMVFAIPPFFFLICVLGYYGFWAICHQSKHQSARYHFITAPWEFLAPLLISTRTSNCALTCRT